MMARLKILCFLLVTFLQVNEGTCQIWPRIYFPNTGTYPWGVTESYDHGFVIGGMYYSNQTYHWGLVFKTDINGEVLWHKKVGNYNDGTIVYDITQTDDGGYILTGGTCHYNEHFDPYFIKLDACGNPSWCRVYSTPDLDYIGKAINPVSDGYIAYVFRYGDDSIQPKLWLFKLDLNGDIVWKQSYAQSDTSITKEHCYTLHLSSDDYYIITGYCYYPDSINGSTSYLKPLIIKADQNGNAEWELPWTNVDGELFYGQGFQSVSSLRKTIYTGGRHIIPTGLYQGDKPSLLKTSGDGNEIEYSDLNQNSILGLTSTIDWFADSTLALGGSWLLAGGSTDNKVIKTDTNGNILKIKEIITSYETFQDGLVTFDNKLLLIVGIATNLVRSYAWKLTSDLEYDTLYTQPFVYDSLCPHPITSDTIPLDCVIVGLEEPLQSPETGRLKVYPNPAWEILHIEIPEHLKTETSNPAFHITTIYHQWKSAMIEVYNLYGREMLAKDIRQADEEFLIDVSRWNAGMYVIRLVYQGQTIASEKVMVN